jgi:subtilisin-like proprotein convertase family protein
MDLRERQRLVSLPSMRRAAPRIGSTIAALALTLSSAAALAPSATAEVVEVTNPTPVLIAKDASCCTAQPASPYPSSIGVTEASGLLTDVEVTLWGLKDSNAEGLQVLLVGPSGQRIVLMASYEAGRHVTLNADWAFRTLSQPVQCPEPEGMWRGEGATEPFNCGLSEPFPEPAPAGPYAGRLEELGNGGGNGEWKLYVANDASDSEGSIATGWSLKLHVQPIVFPPSLGNPEALEHAGLGAQEEYAQFLAHQREAEQAQREREASEREQAVRRTPPPCVVPALGGHTLSAVKRLLTHARCRLGRLSAHRHRHKPLVVVRQSVAKGRHLAGGSAIAIVLGVRHVSTATWPIEKPRRSGAFP